MPLRLLVTADIHGFYSAWRKIFSLLKPDDMLIMAGDIFGTRYPAMNDPDYRPADIRAELVDIPHIIVYGNCDIPEFSPGLTYTYNYVWENKRIFIFHGDSAKRCPEKTDIIINGHTHVPMIQYLESKWIINPGSPARPRASIISSYAVITQQNIQVLNLDQDEPLFTADFASKVVQQKPASLHAGADCE